jgi:hypothetical protein
MIVFYKLLEQCKYDYSKNPEPWINTFTQEFNYDNQHRLTRAKGNDKSSRIQDFDNPLLTERLTYCKNAQW